MINLIFEYFSYPFVRNAFAVCLLISLCAAVLGVILVLRRFSFLGDGLSHFAFGVVALAAVLNITNSMVLVLPVTVACAVVLLYTGKNAKIKGDAALAMMSVSSLAFGYLVLNIFSSSGSVSADVCGTLFGSSSILTLEKNDVIFCGAVSAVILILFVIFYNKIFSVTFDGNFAYATGIKTGLYNLMLAVCSASVVVLAMELVGSLLISALIVFPAITAMRVCKSFKAVVICAAAVSVFCAATGMTASLLLSYPAGASIVAMNAVIYGGFTVFGKFAK